MGHKKYTLALISTIAVLVLAAAAFNRIIDPFWYYRDIEIKGLNADKPRFARFERHIKPQLLARERPEAIVLGSSLSEIGFDTNDPVFTENGLLRGYNFAFAGASWELQQCHLRYALDVTQLKRVVIGIHPGSLPLADCRNEVASIRGFSELSLLLSIRTLRHSLATVKEQGKSRSSHTRSGRYLYARGVPGVSDRFLEFFERRVRENPRCNPKNIFGAQFSSQQQPATSAGNLDLRGLRWLVRTARENKISLRIFAYPDHSLWLELDYLCGNPRARWESLSAAVKIVAEEKGDADIQIWSFYSYREQMAERIFPGEPIYWQDPSHFNFELGSIMFGDMFGATSVGQLGRQLLPDNVASAEAALSVERGRYIEASPDFYDQMRKVYTKVR